MLSPVTAEPAAVGTAAAFQGRRFPVAVRRWDSGNSRSLTKTYGCALAGWDRGVLSAPAAGWWVANAASR